MKFRELERCRPHLIQTWNEKLNLWQGACVINLVLKTLTNMILTNIYLNIHTNIYMNCPLYIWHFLKIAYFSMNSVVCILCQIKICICQAKLTVGSLLPTGQNYCKFKSSKTKTRDDIGVELNADDDWSGKFHICRKIWLELSWVGGVGPSGMMERWNSGFCRKLLSDLPNDQTNRFQLAGVRWRWRWWIIIEDAYCRRWGWKSWR